MLCRMHLSEAGCLLQEFNRQLQDAGQNDQLAAMRDIAFELAAPAGELRRQRGSGSHKVSQDADITVLLALLLPFTPSFQDLECLNKKWALSVKGFGMSRHSVTCPWRQETSPEVQVFHSSWHLTVLSTEHDGRPSARCRPQRCSTCCAGSRRTP